MCERQLHKVSNDQSFSMSTVQFCASMHFRPDPNVPAYNFKNNFGGFSWELFAGSGTVEFDFVLLQVSFDFLRDTTLF